MGGVALAALMLLRHIRTDVSVRRSGGGLWRQASSVAVGMGMTAALGGAGTVAAQGIRGLGRRSDSRCETEPWDRMDTEAGIVHGAPHTGFDPVPALLNAAETGAQEPETRQKNRTRDYASEERVLAGERVVATRGELPGVDLRAHSLTDQPDPRGTSARDRETQLQLKPDESGLDGTAAEEKALSIRAIADGGRQCPTLTRKEPRSEMESEIGGDSEPRSDPRPDRV